ncbi:beta-1,3-galactosyltransferase 5-like [Macrobrachium rosenbergii]|uniref:beta-1,3-galactosyltransferase 5-like n=1 Tax=Macrobrachium rosenbergii TaxID=79674 RepID=UPI0034D58A4F
MSKKHSLKEYSLALVTAVAFLLLICFTWEAKQSSTLPAVQYVNDQPPLEAYASLFPSHISLMDLGRASFIVNSAVCNDADQPVLLLYLVFSHPYHKELRDTHRKHTSQELLKSLGSRRVFFLADGSQKSQENYPTVPMPVVLSENGKHRDLVVADFIDHYRNLTYKHAMALSWAKHFCPQARYILKMDDDIMVDVWGMTNLLRSGLAADNFGVIHSRAREVYLDHKGLWAAGLQQRGLRPQRGSGKWKVTMAEFPGSVYPNYLSGWAYIITQPAASAIVTAAGNNTPFWIDDVYMTGILAVKARVKHYSLNHHYTLTVSSVKCCLEGKDTVASAFPLAREAPLCNLLVAPSGKNVTLLASWLSAARNCYQANRCPQQQQPGTCPPTRPYYGVGTVIPLS